MVSVPRFIRVVPTVNGNRFPGRSERGGAFADGALFGRTLCQSVSSRASSIKIVQGTSPRQVSVILTFAQLTLDGEPA